MIICQKMRLSQPIEMCTQFTRTQMPHIFPRNEHRKIFSTIQRQFLNTTEIYSGGSKAVWSFSENSSKFGNSIVPYLGHQIQHRVRNLQVLACRISEDGACFAHKSFHETAHEIHRIQENTQCRLLQVKKKKENLEKEKGEKLKKETEEPIEEADRAGPECPNHIFPRATCQHRNILNSTQKYSQLNTEIFST